MKKNEIKKLKNENIHLLNVIQIEPLSFVLSKNLGNAIKNGSISSLGIS